MSRSRMYGFCFWSSLLLVCSVMWVEFSGCQSTCQSSADCSPGLLCLASDGSSTKTCQSKPDSGTKEEKNTPDSGGKDEGPKKDTAPVKDQDVNDGADPIQDDSTKDAIADAVVDEPPTQKGELPKPGDLVINEIHADPKSGVGDANEDGTSSSSQDEFIEFVNVTDKDINLSKVVLNVSGKDLYTFADGTVLPAKTAVVVFGGGMTGDTEINTGKPHSKFGGALVYTKGLSLTNSGKKVTLKDKDGNTLSEWGYGSAGTTGCAGDKDQSVTRWPDLTGECSLHSKASDTQALFSPGKRVGGGLFSDPPPPPKEPTVEITAEPVADAGVQDANPVDKTAPPEPRPELPSGTAPGVGDLVINEVLYDPGSDANKDGKVSTTTDEFIEIVNTTSKSLDLTGVTLSRKTTSLYTWGAFILPANSAVVIFRGGMTGDKEINTGKPHSKFNGAYVFTGLKAALLNSGDTITVKNAQSVDIDTFTYGGACVGKKTSVNRDPDLTAGTCKAHKSITAANNATDSAGTKVDGTAF